MRSLAVALVLSLFHGSAAPAADSPAPPSEMKKLEWMVGEWEGEGWIQLGRESRQTFRSREIVESRLGGAVLVVEGIHHGKPTAQVQAKPDAKEPADVVVHHALAVVSWDAKAGSYRFLAHLADGRFTPAEGKLLPDGSFQWGFKEPERGITVRYSIRVNEKGQWVEVGEVSRDGTSYSRTSR